MEILTAPQSLALTVQEKTRNPMKSKQQKREEANERNAAYAKLTTEEKLNRLPATGAERQRKKLLAGDGGRHAI